MSDPTRNPNISAMLPPTGPIPNIPSLRDIKLNSFSATPAMIKGGGTVEVQWSATVPRSLSGVIFRLNGNVVGAFGKQTFRPAFDTAYSLIAERYGSHRTLASTVVDVDTEGCTVPGAQIPVGDLGETIRIGVADLFNRPEKYRAEVSPGITLLLWIERLEDMTFTFDSSKGALRLFLPLKVKLESGSAEGEIIAQVWFALTTQAGRVVALNAKTETEIKLPWEVWLFALGSPIHAAAVLVLLNGIGPDLASGKIKSALGPIADIISGPFGDRVSGVRIDYGRRSPEDELEPFVFTTVCP